MIEQTPPYLFSPIVNNSLTLTEAEKKAHSMEIVSQEVFNEAAQTLHSAAFNGKKKVVQCLLDQGADIDCKDDEGYAPLHIAAYRGHLAVIETLIERGANLHHQNAQGNTALHLAALNGHTKIVEYLIRQHVDPKVLDLENRSSLIYAHASGWKEIISLLKRYDPKGSFYAKQYLTLTWLANSNELEGYSTIYTDDKKPHEISRLAGVFTIFWKKIRKSSLAFMRFEKSHNLVSEEDCKRIDYFCWAAECPQKAEQIFEQWKEHHPVFLRTGFNDHHAMIMIWDNWFMHLDRSGKNNIPHQFHHFDKACLDENTIKELISIKKTEEQYIDMMETVLPEKLKFTPTPWEEKLKQLKIPLQQIDNCVWANSEPLLILFMLCGKIKEKYEEQDCSLISSIDQEFDAILAETEKLYWEWVSFNQISSISRYLDLYKKNPDAVIDFPLICDAFKRNYFENEKRNSISFQLMDLWDITYDRLIITQAAIFSQ